MEIFKLMATIALNSNEAIQELKHVEQQAEQTSSSLGEKLGNLGSLLKTGLVAGAATAGAALAGIGIAAFKIGESFDEAYDTIRAGTGATGESLERLKEDFRAVAARVPVDFAQVGTAIADLNTRMGVSGPLAQSLAEQFLNLSRITGQDVGALIAQGSQAFNSWGIAAEDAGSKLDYLWRVSQATGIGVDQLMAQVTQFGPVLRELGFDFETGAAMLGAFEREGINSTAVLTGFRNVVLQAAKDGKSAQQAIQELFDAIKNAKDPTEATKLAIEAFGSRAGPQLAQAIRSGRLDLEQFTASLKAGGDTINGLAAETDDVAQKWQLFKNQLMLAAEPLANTVFGLAGTLLVVLGPAITGLIQGATPALQSFFGWIDSTLSGTVVPALQRLVDWFSGTALPAIQNFAAQAGPLIESALGQLGPFVTGTLLPALQNLASWFTTTALPAIQGFIASAWGPLQSAFSQVPGIISTVLAGLSPVIASFQSIWQTISTQLWPAFQQLLSVLQSVWQTIQTQLWPAIQTLMPVFQALGAIIGGVVVAAVGLAIGALSGLVGFLAGALPGAIQMATGLIQTFAGVVNLIITVVSGVVRIVAALLQGDWSAAWNAARDLVSGVAQAIGQIVSGLVQTVTGLISGLVGGVLGLIQGLVEGVVNFFRNLFNTLVGGSIIPDLVNKAIALFTGLRDTVVGIVGQLKDAVVGLLTSIKDTVSTVLGEAKATWDSIWEGIAGKVDEIKGRVVEAVTGLVSEIKGAFAGSIDWLVEAGADILRGLLNGINSMVGSLLQRAGEIADSIKATITGALDIGSPSRVMYQVGLAVGEGLEAGILDSARVVEDAAGQIARTVRDVVTRGLYASLGYSEGVRLIHEFRAGVPARGSLEVRLHTLSGVVTGMQRLISQLQVEQPLVITVDGDVVQRAMVRRQARDLRGVLS